MQLEHIALNIYESKEVLNFYENILGFKKIKHFNIDKELAHQFFNIGKKTPVYLMQSDGLVLELFVNKDYVNNSFNHTCVKVENREKIVEKAIFKSYKCIRREREHFDQIFIRDKNRNMFELKETN